MLLMCLKPYKISNKKIKKITWYGAYGNTNIGDTLIFYSLYNFVKNPDVEISLSTREKNPITDYGVKTYYRANKKLWKDHIRNSDLVLLGGGGLFEYYADSYKQAENTLIRYLEPLVYARYHNKRYGIVGIGANKQVIPNRLFRFVFKECCSDSSGIITRDRKSLDGFVINGVSDVNLRNSLDPVFTYKRLKRNLHKSVKNIGFLLWPYYMWPFFHGSENLNNIYGRMSEKNIELHSQFVNSIKESISELRQRGLNIYFPYFHFSDGILLKELGYSVPKDVPSVEDYFNLLQECDVVVTMRYHGQITSLINNIPIVSIVVQEKMDALVKHFCLERYSLDISEISTNKLVSTIESVLDDYVKVKEELFDRVLQIQNRVQSDYSEYFKNILQ